MAFNHVSWIRAIFLYPRWGKSGGEEHKDRLVVNSVLSVHSNYIFQVVFGVQKSWSGKKQY